jgi:hypothetical protein
VIRSRNLATFAVVLLAAGLAGPLAAESGNCPVRREQPVVVTKFELGPILRGKVPAEAFEREMSRSLSEIFRCTQKLQFLEWRDGAANARGTLRVSMVLDGEPPGVPIRLVFRVTEGGLLHKDLNLGEDAVLYHAQDSQVPGLPGGERWKKALRARFRNLVDKHQGELVHAFSFIPLVKTEDLLISQSRNIIGLPVSPGRLSAGPTTQVQLEFLLRGPDKVSPTKDLWVTCLLKSPEWESRLQLALVEKVSEIGADRSRDWPELSSQLAVRVPGSTKAYLKTFAWQDPRICGRLVGPGQ